MARLEGKVALVTGGGNGIGRACARRFAGEGAAVVVGDLLEDAARAVAAEIASDGGRAEAVRLDATSVADNEAAIGSAVSSFGPLDVLVTAAGISHKGYVSGDRDATLGALVSSGGALLDPARAFADTLPDAWAAVLDVNLTGTMHSVTAFARHLLDAGRPGSVVTIASIAAKVPEAAPAAYSVSKAGVWMLTKHAAAVLAPHGIRVNAVGPGFIETNMTAIIREFDEVMNMALAQIPMKRMGVPDEIANVVLFLASDEASYVTGELFHADGGFYTD
jgi:NAD(P)-dependent dehydrogenase (short-subunit alcohol dehydrogenase family)